jgi:hypothetical protein
MTGSDFGFRLDGSPANTSGLRSNWYALTVVGILLVLAAVAVANALMFPDLLGYDVEKHRGYIDVLFQRGHIPGREESKEFDTPPGFYAVAGGVKYLAEKLGASDPWAVARALNVVWVLATAVLTLLIARLLFPGRRFLQLAALAFAALMPAVLKLAAMFHPEPLSLFVSTFALYLAVRMFVRLSFSWLAAALLGVALGAAQLVRGFNLWLVPVVLAGFAAAWLSSSSTRRATLVAALVTLVATALVAGPWYIRQTIRYSNPLIFDRKAPNEPIWDRRPASFYFGLGPRYVFTTPIRPHFLNQMVPTLYSDIWGDYHGYFAWATDQSAYHGVPPDRTVKGELAAQNLLGLIPTILALGGWLALLYRSLRRRENFRQPGLLVVALLPLAGLLGFLIFTVSYPSGDGDVLKASYLLTTVPAWAIAFAYALTQLTRNRIVFGGLVLACAAAAASDLFFLLHRGPLGPV